MDFHRASRSTLSLLILLLAISVVAGSGCSKSSKSKNAGVEVGSDTLSDEDLALQEQNEQERFAGGNIPKASEGTVFKDIYFDYDSPAVQQEDYEIVKENTAPLLEDPNMHAEIEGHCDKRGTAEYNLALGEERAKAVAAIMVSFGAKAEQLSTISYGEEIPVDPGDSESAYSKNRRVHFVIYRRGQGEGAAPR